MQTLESKDVGKQTGTEVQKTTKDSGVQKEEKGTKNSKPFDLEERTFEFARDVRSFVRTLPRTLSNIEDARQLINSSGSVGANYIEANEALGRKDFVMRIKISRKEAKESRYWLRLLYTDDKPELETGRTALLQEATELTSIFGAIMRKAERE